MSVIVTTSDLLPLPHYVILRTDTKMKVIDFPTGHEAHEYAQKKAGGSWGKVIVACQVRVLESASHRFRHKNN